MVGVADSGHVVGQQVVSDICVHVVVEVSVACVLNLIMLTCYYACSLMYSERLFCFKYQAYSTKNTL